MAKRPPMPKSDPKIAGLFETLLPADERIAIRPMFGHKAAFVNSHMFTGTFGSHVFVRLDEPSRAELLAVAGAAPFEPMKGRPMREYMQLPDTFLAEPTKAKVWVERALTWTSMLPPKVRPGRTKAPVRRLKTIRTRSRKKGTSRVRRSILSPWHRIHLLVGATAARGSRCSAAHGSTAHIPGIGRNSNTSIDAPGDMKCGWFFRRPISASFDSAWRIE